MQIVRPTRLVFYLLIALIVGATVSIIGWQAVPGGAWAGLPVFAFVAWLGARRPLGRWRATRGKLPEPHVDWLRRHVPFYASSDAPGRAAFERDVQLFLAEQRFEGVGGVAVTDELRLGVAAGAALLLHGRPSWELPTRHTFLFYPGTFDDTYHDSFEADFDGMAHAQGPVILSARAVEEGWANPADGSNVVLHELAHLLDYENAFADGVPSLLDPGSAVAWGALVRQEMRKVRLGKSMLRRYAATDAAEFFAVAVENFFERPGALRRRHARLFDALQAFFAFDPSWDQDAYAASAANEEAAST